MAQGKQRELTSLERRFMGKGKIEAMQRDVLRVLDARGTEVPPEVRRRVLECGDVEQLDAWLVLAVRAERASDLVEDGD